MGVYIKGMEMPIDCLHCCFSSGCSYCEGSSDHCVFEPDDIETDWDFAHGVFPESIPDWCPLVHVPPHGDLIDKNELKENCMKENGFLAEMLFRKVSNASTIIPAEETTP